MSTPAQNNFHIFNQPLEYGSFRQAPIALPRVSEAIFMNIKQFKYFALFYSSCHDFDIGDRRELRIERLYIASNSRLKKLPNVKYPDLKEVWIENCPALLKLPDDFYNNLNLKITIKDCSNLSVKANSNITFL